MNLRSLRRFAPIGLYVAGLAALAAIGLFIIDRAFTLPVQISATVIVLGLAAAVLLNPQGARQALTGRQARYGSNALLMTIAFIGIVVVINYLVYQNPQQWDLTEDQTNSLTTETIDTIASLETPVKADAYYSAQMSVDSVRSMLQNYKNKSNGKFDFEIIDPVVEQGRAKQDQISRDGTIVLKMEGRQEHVTFASEEEITGALIRLANPGTRAVYFITGHGEYSLDGTSTANYNQIRSSLQAKNYTINTLNLLASPTIPEDALAVIVAGADMPLSQQEIDLIRAYQEAGGSLVYLAEPNTETRFGTAQDPMEAYLKDAWGIELINDQVLDLSSNQPLFAISQQFSDHSITRKMASMAIVLPGARSMSIQQEALPQEIQLSELAFTSDRAWGETDFEALEQGQAGPDEGKDAFGPLTLAIAGVNSSTQARVLVIGDSDFAGSDGYNYSLGNGDFLLNGIDWAAEQENLISLTARQPIQRIVLTPSTTQMGLLLISSIILLPGLILATGLTVWFQRRRRG